MASLKEIRKRIAWHVNDVRSATLNVYSTVGGVNQLPAVVVMPGADRTGDFRVSLGRSPTWFVDVAVLVSFTEMESNQDFLDDEIDPSITDSVANILSRISRDSHWDDLSLVDAREYGGTLQGGASSLSSTDHMGCILTVEVMTTC